MVGVPGRSKGCITCRRRKKGCDKQTPVCSRCVRAGLNCEGYETDMVWLNSSTAGSPVDEPEPISYSTEISEIRPWMVSYARKKNDHANVPLHDSFVRSAREQLYLGLFWTIMIPNGPQFSQESSDLSSIGWTRFVGELYDSESTLRYATVATAASIIGRGNQDMQLRLKGLQVYNWTIQEMVKAIKEPSRAGSDGLVAAARVMALYELLFGPDGDPQSAGWQRHSEGQLAMFLARGPDSFISGASHQLFIDSRINMIMLAIRHRTTSPFNTADWRTIPWSVIEKSTKDKLIDILAYMPDLILKKDSLEEYDFTSTPKGLLEEILCQCREIEAALGAWASHIDLSMFDYTISGLPLPKPTTDTEFSLLHLSCVYWSVLLMLYSVMTAVSRRNYHKPVKLAELFSGASLADGGQRHDITPTPHIFASKIVHCSHLFFEPSAGLVQGGSGLFPIVSALRFYEMTEASGKGSHERDLLQNLFRKSFVGSQVGRYLAYLQGAMPLTDSEPLEDAAQRKDRTDIRWF